MNIQEREELDYHPQSDLQNAFALSRMEMKHDRHIQLALDAGQFVVARCSVVYCPRTDAAMGERDTFISAHVDESEAIAMRDSYPDPGEESYYRIIGPAYPQPEIADCDVPF